MRTSLYSHSLPSLLSLKGIIYNKQTKVGFSGVFFFFFVELLTFLLFSFPNFHNNHSGIKYITLELVAFLVYFFFRTVLPFCFLFSFSGLLRKLSSLSSPSFAFNSCRECIFRVLQVFLPYPRCSFFCVFKFPKTFLTVIPFFNFSLLIPSKALAQI